MAETKARHHLVAALTCQQMADEWLKLARRIGEVSPTQFRQENKRLAKSARLLEPIGNVPPAEAEQRYYAQLQEIALAA